MGMATVMATEASPGRKRNRKSWGKLTNRPAFVKQIQEQAQQIILLCLLTVQCGPPVRRGSFVSYHSAGTQNFSTTKSWSQLSEVKYIFPMFRARYVISVRSRSVVM